MAWTDSQFTTSVDNVIKEVLQTVFFFFFCYGTRWKGAIPQFWLENTGRVDLKADKLCNYRLKLLLGIERLKGLSSASC